MRSSRLRPCALVLWLTGYIVAWRPGARDEEPVLLGHVFGPTGFLHGLQLHAAMFAIRCSEWPIHYERDMIRRCTPIGVTVCSFTVPPAVLLTPDSHLSMTATGSRGHPLAPACASCHTSLASRPLSWQRTAEDGAGSCLAACGLDGCCALLRAFWVGADSSPPACDRACEGV